MAEISWWTARGVKKNMKNMPFLMSQINAIENASFTNVLSLSNWKNLPVGKRATTDQSSIAVYFIDKANLYNGQGSMMLSPDNVYYVEDDIYRLKSLYFNAGEFFYYYKTFSLIGNWNLLKTGSANLGIEYGIKSYLSYTSYNQLPTSYYVDDPYNTYTDIAGPYLEFQGQSVESLFNDYKLTQLFRPYNIIFWASIYLENTYFNTILNKISSTGVLTDINSNTYDIFFNWERDNSDYQFSFIVGGTGNYGLSIPLNNNPLYDIFDYYIDTGERTALVNIDSIRDRSDEEYVVQEYFFTGNVFEDSFCYFDTDDEEIQLNSEYEDFI